MLIFYFLAVLVTFLGVLINLPGSLHFNPILLHFYSANDALLMTTVLLTQNAICFLIIYRKDLRLDGIIRFCIYAVLGGFIAGLFINSIPEKIIIFIFFISALKYLLEYFYPKLDKLEGRGDFFISSFLASFLQTFGMSVGNLRQGYFVKKGYTLSQIQGTLGFVFLTTGLSNFFARYISGSFDFGLVLKILPLFPFCFIVIYIGRKLIKKMSAVWQKRIIVYSLVISLLSVLPKLF